MPPLLWWLAVIPLIVVATSSLAFAMCGAWLWVTAAWIWFGARPSSTHRNVYVNVMTIVIYGMGAASPLPWLGPPSEKRFLAVLVVAGMLAFALTAYHVSKSSQGDPYRGPFYYNRNDPNLFVEDGHRLGVNWGHKLAWLYVAWLVLPFAVYWLLSRYA